MLNKELDEYSIDYFTDDKPYALQSFKQGICGGTR